MDFIKNEREKVSLRGLAKCKYFDKETGECNGNYGDGTVHLKRLKDHCTHEKHWEFCMYNPEQKR